MARDADDKQGVSEGLDEGVNASRNLGDAMRNAGKMRDRLGGRKNGDDNKAGVGKDGSGAGKSGNGDASQPAKPKSSGSTGASASSSGTGQPAASSIPTASGSASAGAASTAGEGAGTAAGLNGIKAAATKAAGTAAGAAAGSGGAPVAAIIVVVVIALLIIMALIAALTPNVTLNTVGSNQTQIEEETTEEEENGILAFLSSIKENLANFFDGADEDDAARFEGANSYEASIPAFKETLDAYLDESVNLRRSQVSNNLSFGDGLTADYGLTLENFDAQGDPFATVDYAALFAAYAVSDQENKDSTLERFTTALKNGEEDMLQVDYTYYDENGNPLENVELIPTPEYAYSQVEQTITGDRYLSYVNAFPDGSPVVAEAEISSWQTDILAYQTQINAYDLQIADAQASIDRCNETISGSQSNISTYRQQIRELESKIARNEKKIADAFREAASSSKDEWAKIDALIKELQDNNDNYRKRINGYQALITYQQQTGGLFQQIHDEAVARRQELTAAKDQMVALKEAAQQRVAEIQQNPAVSLHANIKIENIRDDVRTVVLYVRQLEADGTEKVDHYVSVEEGSWEKDYALLDQGAYGGNYYALIGESTHYPEIDRKYYAEVTLLPFNNADVLAIFDVDPNAIYGPSEGMPSEITNLEMYNYYYDVLEAETDMASYSSSGTNTSGHVCELTADEIQAYLDAIPNVSGNRKQLVKTALELTGAVIYEWGGKPSGPGWNDEWWEPVNHSNGYKGLDCSGFIDWVVWTAFDQNLFPGYSTGEISRVCEVVSEQQLQPGDLGIKFIGGSTSTATNHVGMYIGTDAEGNKLWVHCTGGNSKTVVVNNYSGFQYYLRIPSSELEMDNHWDPEISPAGLSIENEDEMYVIAKCARHEGGASSDVGKQAVVEATCNNIANKGFAVDQHNLYLAFSNQLLGPNFCDSYKRMYETAGGDKYIAAAGEPTQQDYAMIAAVVAGQRDYIKDSRVQNWRSSSSSSYLNGYVFYGQFPAGTGNKFFRPGNL